MKRYLITLKKTNIRWFECEKEMVNFLIDAGETASQYKIEVVECSSIYNTNGKSILDSIILESKRESVISSTFGDEYTQSALKLIELLGKLAQKDPFRPSEIRESAKKIIDKLNACEKTKEKFSKEVKKNSEYLLYCVSNSKEWYSAILATCPIKRLSETCQTEQPHPLTKVLRLVRHRTPEKMIENFENAKKSLLLKK